MPVSSSSQPTIISDLILVLGVVHAVAYSLLLLNTDLHVAELSSRMSRNQFVRNTLSAIQMQLQSSASNSDFDANSVRQGSDHTSSTSHRGKRSDSITSWNSITREGILIMGNGIPTAPNGSKSGNGSTASFPTSNGDPKSPEPVVAPLYDRNWEIEMESMLKVCKVLVVDAVGLTSCPGNLQCDQESAGLTTSWKQPGCEVFDFFFDAPREFGSSSQWTWTSRPSSYSQTGKYPRASNHPG